MMLYGHSSLRMRFRFTHTSGVTVKMADTETFQPLKSNLKVLITIIMICVQLRLQTGRGRHHAEGETTVQRFCDRNISELKCFLSEQRSFGGGRDNSLIT